MSRPCATSPPRGVCGRMACVRGQFILIDQIWGLGLEPSLMPPLPLAHQLSTRLASGDRNSYKWTGRQRHGLLPEEAQQPSPELPARLAAASGCLLATQTVQTQREHACVGVWGTCLASDDENAYSWTGRQRHRLLSQRAQQPTPELPAHLAVASGCLWGTQTAQTQQEHACGCVWDTCLASDGRNS